MVEPVTTAGAAAAGATGVTGAIGDAVSSAASSAANTAGNWFTNLFKAPGGAAKGAFGSLGMGAMFTFGLTVLKIVSPALWRSVDVAVGGEARAARTAAMIKDDGMAGVVLDSAKQGFGLAAAYGAASGAISSGGVIAGGALMVGVGALALGALNTPETPARATGGRAASDTRNA